MIPRALCIRPQSVIEDDIAVAVQVVQRRSVWQDAFTAKVAGARRQLAPHRGGQSRQKRTPLRKQRRCVAAWIGPADQTDGPHDTRLHVAPPTF